MEKTKRFKKFLYSDEINFILSGIISFVSLICMIWGSHKISLITVFVFLYTLSYDIIINSATRNVIIKFMSKLAVFAVLFTLANYHLPSMLSIRCLIAFGGIVTSACTVKSVNKITKRLMFSFAGTVLPIISLLFLLPKNIHGGAFEIFLTLLGFWGMFFALTVFEKFYVLLAVLDLYLSGIIFYLSVKIPYYSGSCYSQIIPDTIFYIGIFIAFMAVCWIVYLKKLWLLYTKA